ncbi:MAG: hypothetical protein ACRC2S_26415 [Waterburya sp.]
MRANNDYYTTSWHGQGFFPRGNPLLNLTEAEKQLLLVEYQKAIADYITDEGVWQDSTTLYVRAYK